MKINKFASVVLGLVAMAMSANATVSLNTQFGIATNAAGQAVPDGTLWALIVNNSGDATFGNTFGVNGNIKSFSSAGLEQITTTFGGKSIALGSVFGGDTIFALGGFNGTAAGGFAGASFDSVTATIGSNGVVEGANFAFLFFPGVTFTTTGATYQIGGEIGGVSTNAADAGAGTGGLVIPPDGASGVSVGANTNDPNLGGSYSAAAFQAVAIPEPSAALLGAIGALGLLRRRRN